MVVLPVNTVRTGLIVEPGSRVRQLSYAFDVARLENGLPERGPHGPVVRFGESSSDDS